MILCVIMDVLLWFLCVPVIGDDAVPMVVLLVITELIGRSIGKSDTAQTAGFSGALMVAALMLGAMFVLFSNKASVSKVDGCYILAVIAGMCMGFMGRLMSGGKAK